MNYIIDYCLAQRKGVISSTENTTSVKHTATACPAGRVHQPSQQVHPGDVNDHLHTAHFVQ